jgi:hypothetical protein
MKLLFDHYWIGAYPQIKKLEIKQWEKGYKDDWPVEMVYPN